MIKTQDTNISKIIIPTKKFITIDDFILGNRPSGDITITASSIGAWTFANRPITSIYAPNVTTIGDHAFDGCPYLIHIDLPNVLTIGDSSFYNCTSLETINIPKANSLGPWCFRGCTSLQSAILPGISSLQGAQTFNSTPAIVILPNATSTGNLNCLSTWKGTTLDLGASCATLNYMTFNGMNSATYPFNTLILRRSAGLVSLGGGSNLPSAGEFRSGGAGGTIYIPKVLYDHLGDNSSLDYTKATNWTAVLSANENTTFEKIEGSPYEFYYADGTSIREV